ncbi:MAG TPA: radical SAM protein, partial [Anseongella sp.]|nr:radical SAM protein [Anseongella sp.]
EALKYGVEHRRELLAELPPVAGFNLEEYLMNHLSFSLDEKKKEGLALFLRHIGELRAEAVKS